MGLALFLPVLLGIGLYLFIMAYSLCYPLLRSRGPKKAARPLEGGEGFCCETSDGYRLHGFCYEALRPSERAVILLHDSGHTGASLNQEARWFLSRGYHVIVYNQRSRVTWGYKERKDLRLILTLARQALGEDCRIGTYGVGNGAVTALLHACLDDRVAFVIADSPWSDPVELLRESLRKRQYPPYPILWAAEWVCRVCAGFSLRGISPKQEIRRRSGLLAVPVLLIAGEQDRRIPAEMSRQIYEAKQGDKALYQCVPGERGRNWAADPVQYESQLDAFLRENLEEKRAI